MKSWLLQRVSAVFIAFFVIYFAVFLGMNLPLDYLAWHDWVANTFNKVVITLFFMALLIHAWVGIRDVIIDYIHPVGLRFSLLTGVIGALVVLSVWLVLIIVGVR